MKYGQPAEQDARIFLKRQPVTNRRWAVFILCIHQTAAMFAFSNRDEPGLVGLK